MAIYSMSMSYCGKGGASKAAVDYQHREGKYEKLLEQKQQEQIQSKIMLGNREVAAKEYATWVSGFEKSLKKNQTRVLDKHMVALPREFSAAQQMEVCEKYLVELQRLSNSKLSNWSIAIHNDQKNPHAHISFVARNLEGQQIRPLTALQIDQRTVDRFELSADLKGQRSADLCRKAWADVVNDYSRTQGIGVTVDHRSLKAQGIERLPTVHVGPEYRNPSTDYQQRLKTHNEEVKHDPTTIQRASELVDLAKRTVRVAEQQNDWLRQGIEGAERNATTVHELHSGINKIRAGFAEFAQLIQRAVGPLGAFIEELTWRAQKKQEPAQVAAVAEPKQSPSRRSNQPPTPQEFDKLLSQGLSKSPTLPLKSIRDTKPASLMETRNAAGQSFKDYLKQVKGSKLQESTHPSWLQSAIQDAKEGKIERLQSLVAEARRNPESGISKQILEAVKAAFPEQASKAKTRKREDDFTR